MSGGKLTTFRPIALDVLRRAASLEPSFDVRDTDAPVFSRPVVSAHCPEEMGFLSFRRISGRYGRDASRVMECAERGELECVPGTNTLWAELRWAARAEAVVGLEDLMLRRTRLGLLLKGGGGSLLEKVKAICGPELGWDNERWHREERAYRDLWRRCYGVP